MKLGWINCWYAYRFETSLRELVIANMARMVVLRVSFATRDSSLRNFSWSLSTFLLFLPRNTIPFLPLYVRSSFAILFYCYHRK
ncbi:MAG: hypothetical protein [Cressdnaviricota sp.]|nr:MAG: hypothetical protein [Cressdnaviricota sp.]